MNLSKNGYDNDNNLSLMEFCFHELRELRGCWGHVPLTWFLQYGAGSDDHFYTVPMGRLLNENL